MNDRQKVNSSLLKILYSVFLDLNDLYPMEILLNIFWGMKFAIIES